MNFDEAVSAHTKWKVRLRMVLNGTEKADAAVVSKDNQCDLGKWIHGEGSKHAGLPSYKALLAEHAHFHKCAAEVVAKANAGNKAAAEALLGTDGSFSHASNATIKAILKMKTEAVA